MSDTLVTVAICIGNEDSCSGYSFLHEYSSDPLRIKTIIGQDPSSPRSLCFYVSLSQRVYCLPKTKSFIPLDMSHNKNTRIF